MKKQPHSKTRSTASGIRRQTQKRQTRPFLANQPLQQIFDRISDGVVSFDSQMNYTYVNKKGAELLGRKPEDLIGKNYWNEYPEAKGTPFADGYLRALKEQETIILENYYQPFERWFENRIYPSKDGISIFFTEITERKQAEIILSNEKNILEMITRGDPLSRILEAIALKIEAQSREMFCTILLLDPDGIHVRHGAAPSMPESFIQAIDGQPIGPNAGSCGTAAYRKEPVVVSDIATDPLWADYRQAALKHGLRSCWSTPIMSADGAVLGTFAMYYREPRSPGLYDLRLIALATRLAKIAIEHKRVEEALSRSEAKFRLLSEQAGDGIISIDTEGKFTYVNDSFCKMLGYPKEELLTLSIASTYSPEDRAAIALRLTEIKKIGTSRFERAMIRKDGTTLPIEVVISRISDGLFQGIIRDITERKRAEEVLHESEARYRALVEQASDALFVHDMNARFVEVNKRACESTGYSREELLQMRVMDIEMDFDLKGAQAEWVKIKEGEPFTLFGRQKRKDGSIFPVEARFGLFSLKGEKLFLVLARDVTERKQAEQALRASEERLRLVLDGLGPQMFVGLMDTRGVLLLANKPAMDAAELRSEEVIGKPFQDTYWWAYSEVVQQRLHAVIQRAAQGEAVRYDEQVRVAEDRLIWIDFSLQPLRDESGKVAFIVPSAMVIQERKRAEEGLRHAMNRLIEVEEEMRKQTAQELHDQVGQNLTALTINLNYLQSQLSRDAIMKVGKRLDDSLRLLEDTVERIRDIMTELYPSVLGDYGLLPALQWYTHQFTERTSIATSFTGQEITKRYSQTTEHALFRSAQEALTNIAKHAQAKNVSVSLVETDGLLKMTISDDGVGFESEYIHKNKKKLHYGLTGMKERITSLGGEFAISSELGKGTTIIIQL